MNIERPGSPSATMVAPASKRRSTSMDTRRSRLASDRPPKKGVASKNAFRSGELSAIGAIYSRSRKRQVGKGLSRPREAAGRTPSGLRSARDLVPFRAGALLDRHQPRLVVGLVDYFRRKHHLFRQRLF